VVTTGWGGTLDFLPETYPYLVDYDLIPSGDDEPDHWSPPDSGWWAKARVAHGAALLRSVYDDRKTAWQAAGSLAPEIRSRFSPEAATARLRTVLARVGSLVWPGGSADRSLEV
jgi:hypothetical protein